MAAIRNDAVYGLFMFSENRWMEDHERVDSDSKILNVVNFFNEKGTPLHFKLRYEICEVYFPAGDKTSKLYIDDNLIGIDAAVKICKQYELNRKYQFFLPTGEVVNGNLKLIDVLKSFSKNDFKLILAPPLQKIVISCITQPASLTIDVNFGMPIKNLMPLICRKLGERIHTVIDIKQDNEPLPLTRSLNELGIYPNTLLVLHVKDILTHAPTVKNILN